MWKLHLPHKYRSVAVGGKDGQSGKYKKGTKIDFALFDMKNDPYEKNNLIEKYPEIAAELKKSAAAHNKEFFNK